MGTNGQCDLSSFTKSLDLLTTGSCHTKQNSWDCGGSSMISRTARVFLYRSSIKRVKEMRHDLGHQVDTRQRSVQNADTPQHCISGCFWQISERASSSNSDDSVRWLLPRACRSHRATKPLAQADSIARKRARSPPEVPPGRKPIKTPQADCGIIWRSRVRNIAMQNPGDASLTRVHTRTIEGFLMTYLRSHPTCPLQPEFQVRRR